MKSLFRSRKFRQGSVAAAITVLVIAIVVVVNMVLSALTDRYSLKLDLTPGKVFGISQATTDFLAGLQKDVEIYVLNSEEAFAGGDQYLGQANEVIQKYRQHSDRIHLQYIDLTRNSGFASRFPEEDISPSNILVVCGDKVRVLTPYDLFDVEVTDYYTQYVTASRAEQAMTSTISGVTNDKVVKAAILTGHNEAPLSELRSLLELNNYVLTDVNILTQEIPEDTALAILAAPLRDYTEEDLSKLDRYLTGGSGDKTLFYMADVQQPELSGMPALTAFLQEWNIQMKDGVVFETDSSRVLGLNPYVPLVDYSEYDYSAGVRRKSLYMTVPTARPMDILSSSPERAASPLLEFSQASGMQPLIVPENWQPSQEDMVGPTPALILSTQSLDTGEKIHLLACGTTMIVEASTLASNTVANSEYILGLLNSLTQQDSQIAIQSKSMSTAQLGLNTVQSLGLSFLLTILLPLVTLICGIVVFFRRRHL